MEKVTYYFKLGRCDQYKITTRLTRNITFFNNSSFSIPINLIVRFCDLTTNVMVNIIITVKMS